ncbi:MAG: hypothetical protein HKN21_13475 [Candidatus Eisenbacteria bacterium]|uniref:Glycosyltransferase RgtA/B/C/D-like domain-containing protein n=1 Tax=Eiseniibacteriota bacterium TaxID=2212470 RepID=A0A7Y2EGE3_UNCEI|nr:hypothetical protein [Candidatus Eisenbacteria bacterium]
MQVTNFNTNHRESGVRRVLRQRALFPFACAAAIALTLGLSFTALDVGPTLTPDSVQYLSAAESYASGHGVQTTVTGLETATPRQPLTSWPPLFPVTIAALMQQGLTPLSATRTLNTFYLVAIIIALSGIARLAAGPGLASIIVLAHAVMFYPVMTATFAWSEPMYTALSLCALYLVGRSHEPRSRALLLLFLAGVLAGFATLSRYIGFVLIGSAFIGIVWINLHEKPSVLLRRALSFSVPAILISGGWLVRNKIVSGVLLGDNREYSGISIDAAAGSLARAIAEDFFAPTANLPGMWGWLGIALGVTGAILLITGSVSVMRHFRFPSMNRRSGFTLILGLYVTLYLTAVLWVVQSVRVDPINTRYLAPIYPIMLTLLVMLFRASLFAERRSSEVPWRRPLLAASAVMLVVPQLIATTVFAARIGSEERTLTAPYWTSTVGDEYAWRDDQGLELLQTIADKDRPVISNHWELVHLVTGLPTKPMPNRETESLEPIFRFPGSFIALHLGTRPYLFNREDLDALAYRHPQLKNHGVVGSWALYEVLESN